MDSGLVERVRRQRARRAALLLLTDRQVAWLVDHAAPGSLPVRLGVDVISIPVEQLVGVAGDDATGRDDRCGAHVARRDGGAPTRRALD